MRKSLPRDHESHVMGHGAASAASSSQMPPSPKTKKTRTGLSSTFKQSESSLQGIQEEQSNKAATTTTEDRPVSPRKMTHEPSTHRRSSCTMDAPILASAFVTSTYPESHDEQQQHGITPIGEEIKDETDVVGDGSSSSGAFAFDAGAAITQEFGERVARLLGADPWGDRQDGFDAIMYIVKKADLASAKNKRELFCAALAAIQCGVDDRVAPVMYCALECLRAVLKEFAPVIDRTFVKYAPTNEQLSALVKSLTAKLGDSNKRTQREVSQALIRVAKQKKLKSLPHVLLHLSAKEVAPRIQVATLRQLVSELDVDSKYGLSLDVVMQFAVPALKIADEKTRKAAVELIADLQMNNPNGGAAVTAQLVGIKPEMLRVINRRVEELVAQREKEQQAAQSTNQSEEAHGAGGDDGDLDDQRALELVSVPLEDAKKVIAMIDFQLQQAAGVIGPVAWRKLESKTWSDRKEALVDIDKLMADAKSDLRDARPAFGSVIQQNFLAYCITVHKCLADSIAPVVNSAMDCLSTLIKVFGPFVEWREESVRDVVLLTIMRLFSTMQKPNNRTNRAACRSILKFARLTNAHTLRYTLSCIFAKETDALVQMHLLRLLIPEFGFQQDGISAAMVLAAVGSALVHANEKVRKTAIDVALCTQRLVGKEYVLKKLKDVKAVTLKELEKNFVDCDVKKDGDRPQTVNGSSSEAGGLLPPVSFASDQSRRLLNSAPVGVGKLQCTPPGVDEDDQYSSSGHRRASVLSNDEENLMDAILDGGDF
uniref:TOG domain-containing protein n=1 Tax=Globisporangium ultimum (strain ATCC 200006 / CBS 805.95 / DAOM BR144) TaxID=431595 RepID=K3WKN2_GLOUD